MTQANLFSEMTHVLVVGLARMLQVKPCKGRACRKAQDRLLTTTTNHFWSQLSEEQQQHMRRRLLECRFWRVTGFASFESFLFELRHGPIHDEIKECFMNWCDRGKCRSRAPARMIGELLLSTQPLTRHEAAYCLVPAPLTVRGMIGLSVYRLLELGCVKVHQLGHGEDFRLKLIFTSQHEPAII